MQEVGILYVGDIEQSTVLLAQIHKQGGQKWKLKSVEAQESAHQELDNGQFDVVIIDAAYPQVNAVELLIQLKERWPKALRYVVADVNDKAEMFQLLEDSHQVVSRPLDASTLIRQLQNALNLRQLLTNEELQTRVASIKTLPCMPETFTKLSAALRNDDVSLHQVANLVSADAAITAKLLQVVNSAYFSVPKRVDNVLQAINLLGTDTIKSLVLSTGVFSHFKDISMPEFSIDQVYDASMSVGAKSRLLAHSLGFHPRAIDEALLGGMLHNIGKLLMAKYFQAEFKEALEIAGAESIPLHKAEQLVLGVNDATVGAYLLSLWGLSDPVVESVALHYTPGECLTPMMGPLAAVHLAWAMDDDDRRNVREDQDSLADCEYLTKLGITQPLSVLRGFCGGAVAAV